CQTCAHEQAAVGPALDRQLVPARVVLADQKLRGGNKIVKDVLLLAEHARLVPFLAVLTAAAKVGNRQNAAFFQKQEACGIERRGKSNVEAPVAIEQRRIVAVPSDALLVGQEHGD